MAGRPAHRRSAGGRLGVAAGGVTLIAGLGLLGVVAVLAGAGPAGCPVISAAPGAPGITRAAAVGGTPVGASEYGGPGDPASGTIAASGADLRRHPDSFAELGGETFATADALGGLPYMTALRVSWDGRSAVAYKRDFGLGGGPVDGRPRVIDLWWRLATALAIPYTGGRWSGTVTVAPVPGSGAAELLGQAPGAGAPEAGGGNGTAGCSPPAAAAFPLSVISGPRAQLLADGQAAVPAGAPPAVAGMIAAGNAIAGRPYVYGAAHGLPLDELAPAYDCSSSVEHLLYGGGLLPVGYGAASSALESFGRPGPGRWVTIYASAAHVFMYVAGLRWDTWNAAGPGDGAAGIGWHPLVRDAAGFVARHPVGL